MKKCSILFLTILLVSIVFPTASFPLNLYDDFSGPFIDKNKWKWGEWVREIDTGIGKLLFKHGSDNPTTASSFPYTTRNGLLFSDPNSVNSIQADVTILENQVSGAAYTRARLEGRWYYNDGTGGVTEDIYAEIGLRLGPTGIVARWVVTKWPNVDPPTEIGLAGGDFTTPITLGTTYTLYIGYDSVSHQFTFRVGGEEITFGPTGLPARAGNANRPGKSFTTRVQIDNQNSSGYIVATFDNVYKNGVLYDTFSSPTIDSTKWTTYEFVREISGGKLRSKTRSSSASTSFIDNEIAFVSPSQINALQTRVTLSDYQNPQGLYELAGISGAYYNDGTPGGGRIGDVVAEVLLGGRGVNPVAGWRVYKYTNADGTTADQLASGTFTGPVTLGNTYTLFLGWNGSKFTFRFENEAASYTPATSINPVYYGFRRLRTIIYPETDKKEATIEALFDDVMAVILTEPTLSSATFFGGSGDQRGTRISIANGALYLSGISGIDLGAEGLVVEYAIPSVSLLWSVTWPNSDGPDGFNGIAVSNEGVYLAGYSHSQTTDGCGGKEPKSVLVKFPLGGGTSMWTAPVNFFPYRGWEWFKDVATDGSTYIYAVGDGEPYGWGPSAMVLAKYDTYGNRLNMVTEPGLTLGFDPCGLYQTVGQSWSSGVIVHNNNIYVVGVSALTGVGEDSVYRPFLSKFDSNLIRQWKRRPTDFGPGGFLGVTGVGSAIYAVGYTYTSGVPNSQDYLIQKYDEAGNLLWSRISGGSNTDILTGVVGIGSRLFAAGYTRSQGAGGADAVILEIDPATGNTLSTTLYGGAQDDMANGVATDGTDLYVVGESRSFTVGGNAVGQNDVMLLRYYLDVTNGGLYDDFNGDQINSTLWDIEDRGVLSQSGGLLNADGPPISTYGVLGSTHIFRGDFEFVLDYRNFQSTATVFTENHATIWLQVTDYIHDHENFIGISRVYGQSGHTLFSSAVINGQWVNNVWSPASSVSGLLKISRTGSTITTHYNEGAGWVAHGTFTNAFTGDVYIQIAVYTGDNGTFHVSSDWITYEGQMLPKLNDTVDEFPIATTTGREMAASAAFDGTNYLVGIQGDQNSNQNITAQLVSQSGTLVGSRISVGGTGGAPLIAFDGTNYLMVWEEDTPYSTHIYGQFISKAGTLVGSQITVGTGSDMHLYSNQILFDGTNYFVVWENRVAPYGGDTADVYAQFITPSGTLLGSAIPVSTVAHGQRDPTLAFDGTNILVVWTDGRNQSACYTDLQGTYCYESDIYGQFVTKSSSSSAGTLFGTNFAINTSTLPRDGSAPYIAFDGTNYLITFAEETTLPNACPQTGCKWDLFGQLISMAGNPVGAKITISTTAPDHHFPIPVYDGTRYLITWTEGLEGTTIDETSIKGRFFDTSGSPVGPEFILFSPAGGRIPWLASTIFNGSEYFSVINRGTPGADPFDFDTYTNMDVYGAFIPDSGKNPLNDTTEFVKQQYRDFLNREAETAGLQYWVNIIDSGAMTRAQVIESFFWSEEFGATIAPVVRLYFAYFLRIPDYGGLMYWINVYKSGGSLGAISDSFAGSEEFQQTYGSLNNGEFVNLIYQNILGRAPDPGGYAFWVGELNSGRRTRGQVMIGFSESAEYKGLTSHEVYVTMMYIGMLRRSPEEEGFNFWVNYLDSGNSGLALIDGFLYSQEYADRFQ